MANAANPRVPRQVQCPNCFKKKPDGQECPFCHLPEERIDYLCLPYRSRLNMRYITGRVMGKGERSVIYLALDTRAEDESHKKVAIKEYLPWVLVTRPDDHNVIVDPNKDDGFAEGLREFEKEAQVLRRLVHDNIVRYKDYFRANGTAYIVLEYCDGKTLADVLADNNQPLLENVAINLFSPILNALEYVHRNGVIHCDVNPRNIQISEGSRPVLLDFGSAQYSASNDEKALHAVTINPGYSSPEQHEGAVSSYGAWTDIYACSATLYQLTTGRIPLPAPQREIEDSLLSLRGVAPDVTESFSAAIMRGLSLDRFERPDSVSTFRHSLGTAGHRVDGHSIPLPHPGVVTARAKRSLVVMRQSAVPFAIYLLFLSLLYFVFRPVADAGHLSSNVGAPYVMNALDYYILRDVSGSIDQKFYDLVEGIIKRTARPQDRSDPDLMAYAEFAATVTNGYSTIEPAAQYPDIVKKVKDQLLHWSPPPGFYQRTSFTNLFTQTIRAINDSDQGRDILVFVITDGVPDSSGHEDACVGPRKGRGVFFDTPTEQAFYSLVANPRVHLVIALLGGRPECAKGVEHQWNVLAKKFNVADRGRFKVLPLSGYDEVQEIEHAILTVMSTLGRGACVTLRPVLSRLVDDQRQEFDERSEFYSEILLQTHLGGNYTVDIPRAYLLDDKANRVSLLGVLNRDHGDLAAESDQVRVPISPGTDRDGEEHKVALFFQMLGKFKPDPRQRYWIRPVVQIENGALDGPGKVRDILADVGPRARMNSARAGRLLVVFVISVAFGLLVIGSLFVYVRRKGGGQVARSAIRETILKPFRHWVVAFVLTAALLLLLGAAYMITTWLSWLLGASTLLFASLSAYGLFSRSVEEMGRPSRMEILMFSLDAIVIPLVSLILAIPAL